MTHIIEFRRRQNGQTVGMVSFTRESVWKNALEYIIKKHSLTRLDNNKRDEQRYWNGNGIILAAYSERRIPSVVALVEADRLFG